MSSSGYLISDVIIFKYCLGGLTDRALLLKEVATSASEEELLDLQMRFLCTQDVHTTGI